MVVSPLEIRNAATPFRLLQALTFVVACAVLTSAGLTALWSSESLTYSASRARGRELSAGDVSCEPSPTLGKDVGADGDLPNRRLDRAAHASADHEANEPRVDTSHVLRLLGAARNATALPSSTFGVSAPSTDSDDDDNDDEDDESDAPPMSVAGVNVHRPACLVHRGDRLIIVPDERSSQGDSDAGWRTFLASDLCAMGHTTKDPAHLLSWVLDELSATAAARRNQKDSSSARDVFRLRVVYGNGCMTRDVSAGGGNKRTPVFHGVLLDWFRAVLGGVAACFPSSDTSKKAPRQRWSRFTSPGDRGATRPPADLCRRIRRAGFNAAELEEVFFSEVASKRKCYSVVAKREERWRWFRTSSHAAIFRSLLHRHFGLSVAEGASVATRRGPIVVTVLRRDEDRHFDEAAVAARWRLIAGEGSDGGARGGNATAVGRLGAIRVQLLTFDRVRGGANAPPPPSHQEQLRLLAASDVLVAAHGAGLASIAAMLRGSVVVELFPNNFRYAMYEELAEAMALRYIGWESTVVWPPNCCRAAPQRVLASPAHANGVGARGCKKCDIRLTAAMGDALLRDAVGYVLRQRYRNEVARGAFRALGPVGNVDVDMW